MTQLTRDVRDRAVAALRQAHDEGRPVLTNTVAAERADGTIEGCSCYIVARAFDIELGQPDDRQGLFGRPRQLVDEMGYTQVWSGGRGPGTGGGAEIYDGLERLGLPITTMFTYNDTTESYAEVANWLEMVSVIDEAEAITRDAATNLVGA